MNLILFGPVRKRTDGETDKLMESGEKQIDNASTEANVSEGLVFAAVSMGHECGYRSAKRLVGRRVR